VKDLTRMLPEDLPEPEFRAFFDRSSSSWRPYAAGLPCPRDSSEKTRLLKILSRISEQGSEANTIGYVMAESGRGGTTSSRLLAFEAATAGYPALVARQPHFRPESTEIESFLFRVKQKLNPAEPSTDESPPVEVPWVVVFDVTHWAGH